MTANLDFVRSLYAAYSRGDIQAILDNLDGGVEWTSYGEGPLLPWGGTRRGVAGAASAFQALADGLDFEAFEPQEFFDAGDDVIVLGRTRARGKRSGGAFDVRWAHFFAIRDGKVARFREFYDTQAVARAVAA